VKGNLLAAAVGTAVVALGVGVVAPASATDNIQPFGTQERLNDWAGGPMIGYTVQNLVPSADPVPHNGQLYEATLTVNAFGAWATPMIPLFNARAQDSALYRVLPGSGPGGALPPGGSSTGKLYFDVVGTVPNSVVYNDGVRDLLAWVGTSKVVAPGGAPTSGGSSTGTSGGGGGSEGNAQLGPFGSQGGGGGGGAGNGITGSDAGGGGLGGAGGASAGTGGGAGAGG
jgi:hypothetical protein